MRRRRVRRPRARATSVRALPYHFVRCVMKKLHMAALAVIAAGGTVLGTPTPANATYKVAPTLYCCEYRDVRWGFDKVLSSCCHIGGCQATANGCTPA
ncbi:MAG: hypothetical protein AVDCRST_MAG89-1155 [uncultured Gemmatimonadetes bacterium]|uniref:Uncharacterized protein n=1 Tax=uncultured Gemmatimonadota bacterium TaxID=203437 RepID=A0A6J4KQC1_9BACT|nr:MAG: hypothetical protein AVDCRST_MAG89-1155 [uncultured Gemmatimonadota bacterium]